MSLLTYWLYRGAGALIGFLPLKLAVLAGRALGWCAYFIAWRSRRVALRNVAIAFPDKAPHRRRRLARKHFATLGGDLFAMERLARMPRERIPSLVTVEGLDVVLRLAKEKRGFVFLMGHLGNWELLAQMGPMLFPMPCGEVYQRLGNPHFDAHVRRARGRSGLALFERKTGLVAAVALLRKGGAVGIVADQHAGDGGVWCPFFGRLASTSPLAATLASRTGAALLTVAMHTAGVGRWRMVIGDAIEHLPRDTALATARLNLVLEQMIRRQPEDWFWVHNRWKTPRPKFLLASYKRGIVAPPDPTPRQLDEADSGELFEFAAKQHTSLGSGRLQPFRILIRSSNWLGDAVMTVPAVRAIKRGRPDAHITVLTPAKLADAWKLVPEVDSVLAFKPVTGRGPLRLWNNLRQLFYVTRRVRRLHFEVAVIFPNSFRTALEAWLARVPRRVGRPGHRGRSVFLNQVLREKKIKKHEEPPAHQALHYIQLAEFIGALSTAADLDFPALPRRGAGLKPASPGVARIAVCPGAEYGGAKRWLPGRFAEVIKSVSASRESEWLLVGVEKDRQIAANIAARAAPANVENLCGRTTLDALIALLRTCDALLTNDTGTMHLAALLGIPTVAIFGSTEPALTGPLGSGHVILRERVECSPCFLRECPIDFRCMNALSSDAAATALRGVLARVAF